jgi:hypothetical protein
MTSVATVYFYCSYQDSQRNSFIGLARALIAQLLTQNATLLPYLHDQCLDSGQPSLVSSELCQELLSTCLKTSGAVYIIIDGIDECEFAERKSILSFLTPLVSRSDTHELRALIVSQDENDIRKLLKDCTALRLRDYHNKSDIEVYASVWSEKICSKFQLPVNVQHYIMTTVRDVSDGKFMNCRVTSHKVNILRHVPICKARFDELGGAIDC